MSPFLEGKSSADRQETINGIKHSLWTAIDMHSRSIKIASLLGTFCEAVVPNDNKRTNQSE
ncbi:Uncharacterized protein APZ42_010936 [Daphnia magna]|uniref:Uncharacterized protein n=1 Tax=Daphnia magna TaxID=35525 RepID=A0A0P5CA03_9CRUS|nr:Uncharacterized protein APZ42_010936 [Daphnia magna]